MSKALTPDQWDELGRLVDSLDNAVHANKLPMPERLKLEGMTGIVETVRDKLMAFVIEHSGNNPWGDWGEDKPCPPSPLLPACRR